MTTRNQEATKHEFRNSSGFETPHDILSKLLSSNYKGDALSFLDAAIDVVLNDQSNIWTDPKGLLQTMIKYREGNTKHEYAATTRLPTQQPFIARQRSEFQPVQHITNESESSDKRKKLTRQRSRSDNSSGRSTIRFHKSKSEKMIACSAYRPSVSIKDQHLCDIQNIRNMTFEQWSHVKSLPTPELSPYHIQHEYDVNKLKEIWVGVSEKFVWITFCFYPVDETKLIPSAQYTQVEPYYRKIDGFDYICVCVEPENLGKSKKKIGSKQEKLFTFCTEFDIINRLRSFSDYPFPIQMFPILEHASTKEEMMQRRDRARKFFLITCGRVEECKNTGSKKSSVASMIDISKEVGVDMEMPGWASSIFNSPGANCFKALWNTGIIRTAIDSVDVATVTFTINSMLESTGILDLPYYELPRVLHQNLRDSQRLSS